MYINEAKTIEALKNQGWNYVTVIAHGDQAGWILSRHRNRKQAEAKARQSFRYDKKHGDRYVVEVS